MIVQASSPVVIESVSTEFVDASQANVMMAIKVHAARFPTSVRPQPQRKQLY